MTSPTENEIQAVSTAPRVTPADIEANIVGEHYFTAAEGVIAHGNMTEGADVPEITPPLSLLTFCVLVLRNGFTVTGQSACASPENFNAEIGRRIAREDAVRQIWPLLGYQLKEQLYQQGRPSNSMGKAITFAELVQHGKDSGANLINGMPWSFKYDGWHVSHENDECYLVNIRSSTLRVTPADLLVTGPDGFLSVRKLYG